MISILGGYCTDFARHVARGGQRIDDLVREATQGALADAKVAAADVGVVHVGNFTAELFAGQGQLGGLVAALPGFEGTPSARHEAACASGSVAVLAAMADLEAGRYDVALVLGVELMRNVPGDVAARHLGAAALADREGLGARYLWPALFDEVQAAYHARHGVERRHLMALARQGYVNARSNINAQTRHWTIDDGTFAADDATNPIVHGALRRSDCAQVTDGACAVVLARSGDGPRILGWGHRTAPIALADKLARAPRDGWMFPELRRTIIDARRRSGVDAIDAIELHDCFAITGYVILDHLGLAAPGEVGRLIDAGTFAPDGELPVNLSGGLVGLGHPVGATGVRMLHDAARWVRAGKRHVQTLNVGGSFTTTVSFVVG